MLAALVVAIGLGIMNGFHVSWGTGYASSLRGNIYISDRIQTAWLRLESLCDSGTNIETLVRISDGVSMGAFSC